MASTMVPDAADRPEVLPSERLLPNGMAVPALRGDLRRIDNTRNALSVAAVWFWVALIIGGAGWLDPGGAHPVPLLLLGPLYPPFSPPLPPAAPNPPLHRAARPAASPPRRGGGRGGGTFPPSGPDPPAPRRSDASASPSSRSKPSCGRRCGPPPDAGGSPRPCGGSRG